MAFLKRLGFFLIGLSVGLVFLMLFLKKKSEETGVEFCYFPNCRVLKDMRTKPLSYSDRIQQMIQDQKLDSTDIAFFLVEGDINFGKSDTKSVPCKTYFIEGFLNDKDAVLQVKNCTSKLVIEEIEF